VAAVRPLSGAFLVELRARRWLQAHESEPSAGPSDRSAQGSATIAR
jgi:hypothetical protein